MGIAKNQLIEHEIGQEDLRAGLDWLCKYGKKSFQDHTGEWVEVRCSEQLSIFGHNYNEVIPHNTEERELYER